MTTAYTPQQVPENTQPPAGPPARKGMPTWAKITITAICSFTALGIVAGVTGSHGTTAAPRPSASTSAPVKVKPATPAKAAPVPTKTVTAAAPRATTIIEQAPAAAPAPAPAYQSGNCTSVYNTPLYAGPDTSCPFAQNVESAYTGPGVEYVTSPVTGGTYAMDCEPTGGSMYSVTCTGGNNALVQF